MKRIVLISLLILTLFIVGCGDNTMKTEIEINEGYEVATFAGGCFWCMESAFEALDGIEAVSGYAGGKEENPTYEQVSSGSTSHVESIQVYYDQEKYTYEQLLKTFRSQIDPTDEGGSFADRGYHYTSAIFYHNEEQRKLAEKSLQEIENSKRFDKSIVTKILPFTTFYKAEEYHQDYSKKRTVSYNLYKKASGREKFIKENWEDENLKEKLTDIQYRVAVENGTESAFDNEYHDEKRDGIYVDIITGEPLFSSKDKYDSGTGWPSFTKPINDSSVKTKIDWKLTTPRTEVRTETTHLGHVFNDGPKEEGGKRYCLNSAALKFIPKEDLEAEGYGEYLILFNEI